MFCTAGKCLAVTESHQGYCLIIADDGLNNGCDKHKGFCEFELKTEVVFRMFVVAGFGSGGDRRGGYVKIFELP